MYPQTKFGIPTSNNIGDMLKKLRLQVKFIVTQKVRNTLPPQDASKLQIWDSYLK